MTTRNTNSRLESNDVEKTVEDGRQSEISSSSRRAFLRTSAAAGGVLGTSTAGLLPGTAAGESTDWEPKEPPIETPWTGDVSPENAHPEYPRPQLVRDQWRSLNGLWEFESAADGDAPPFGEPLDEEILVPYPVESALSGINRREDRMWYRRTFSVPDEWGIPGRGPDQGHYPRRLLLHFEAVDYETTVYVNGTHVGTHTGGYDAFSFDITSALEPGADEQELIVGVYDPTDRQAQAVGKQHNDPHGIWYTPYSGIWQSVWMEPVRHSRIDRLDATPDLDDGSLRLTVHGSNAESLFVEAVAYDDEEVGRITGSVDDELRLPISEPKYWSPDDPFLYDLQVRLLESPDEDAETIDEVRSYFGMRSIDVETTDGVPRPMLNGEFVVQIGTLDQGYWPDGISTAPTDEALRYDLEAHKELGFNMVRKHVTVEPRRWYYHADRLGLLVWQDMPNMGEFGDTVIDSQWRDELRAMVDQLDNHPSIVTWVPLNEGWGATGTDVIADVAELVAQRDPSRLVNNMSGVNICGCDGNAGDILAYHDYPGPSAPPMDDDRYSALDEYGGIALSIEGHEWDPDEDWGYDDVETPEELTDWYVDSIEQVTRLVERCELSSIVYTQLTDVEIEVNGLLTYNRAVVKPNVDQIRTANEDLIAGSRDLERAPHERDTGTSGLDGVAYWPFDEGSGDTAHDAVGDADATLVNEPTWGDGVSDSAPIFNGVDQYADTGSDIVDTELDYSVSAWVRLESLDGFQTAVSQDGEEVSGFFLQYSDADNRLALSAVASDSPSAGSRALSEEPPEIGVWYHLTGVRDAIDSTLTLYVNGEPVDTVTYCPGFPTDGNLVIGRAKYFGDPVDFWHGSIDRVRVFDRMLSDDEVADLYESGG